MPICQFKPQNSSGEGWMQDINELIVVAGATGGVGQLVTAKLLDVGFLGLDRTPASSFEIALVKSMHLAPALT